jgi:hypothetical protein
MTTARSSPPEPGWAPLARLVELALVVPVEVSGRLIESVPVVADKVPPAAERVRREIVLARFLGKLAVDQGIRELRSRLSSHEDDATSQSAAPTVEPPGDDQDHEAADATDAEVPDTDSLALADYDHLSSAQIVSKLAGLDDDELDAVEVYERAGRHRRTILGKIEQLRDAADTS